MRDAGVDDAAIIYLRPCDSAYDALASSSRATWSGLSDSVAAASRVSTCSGLVALAIGAVMDGLASSQASATEASSAPVSLATLSRPARMRMPRGFMYFGMPRDPRGLLP